jgi:hypothetical protein
MIIIVIGVFTAMQLYVRRGLQARLKSGMDNLPVMVTGQAELGDEGKLVGTETQYEPYYYQQGSQNMSTTTGEGVEKGTITQAGGVREVTGATTSRAYNQVITGTGE